MIAARSILLKKYANPAGIDLGTLESKKPSTLVVSNLDSIDGTRDSPRYVQPKRANPSQNARRFSVRWMASRIETESMPRVRLKMLLSQVSSDSQRETVAMLPGGWRSVHTIRLEIEPFAELVAHSESLTGSQVDFPDSCRAKLKSAPVTVLQSPQRAAKPTPRIRARIRRVPMWKRNRPMAWSLSR